MKTNQLKKLLGISTKKKKRKSGKLFKFLIIFVLVVYISSFLTSFSSPNNQEIPLSEALRKIEEGQVSDIVITDNNIQLQTEKEILFTQKEPNVSFTETLQRAGVDPSKINLQINNQDALKTTANIVATIAPLILTGFIFWYIFKQAGKAQTSLFSFGKSKAKYFRKNGKATFNDIAGLEEAKEELKEVVDFLKNPEKYRKMGARVPKGALLIGPSGTGKTLMARAIAGEAKVPFLHMAGSEFMEMLVGIGASRVRDLFQTARKAKRAIIFIDELDAIGGVRGIGASPGHGEREQTLNQLLVEMDGLEPNETIILLAATNRPDILDPALTRPGRFDRRILLGLPELKEREDILKLHAQGKPFTKSVSWLRIAKRTVGFSGADLENMLNEAAILAARGNKKKITNKELDEAAIKVRLGPQKKRLVSDQEKATAAYHEAGHAVTSYFSPKTDPVERISIVSRGMALGYTLTPPERDRLQEDRTRLVSQIITLMGGRAAEEIVFKETTSGAAQDIKTATQIARKMVVEFGMSPLGPLYFGPQVDTTEWGKSYLKPEEIAPETQAKVDQEIEKIINGAHKKAQEILKGHRSELDLIAKKLLVKETLERKEFEKLIKEG